MKRKNKKIIRIAAPAAALMLSPAPFSIEAEAESKIQSPTKIEAKMQEPQSSTTLNLADAMIANTAVMATPQIAPEQKAEEKAEVTELLCTTQSWDGAQLPDYPIGKPEIKVIKVVLPPHAILPKHHHDVMSYGYLTKGELTIIRKSDGKETTLHAGDAVAETVSTVHYGENRGNTPAEIIVFYASKAGQAISEPD